MNVFYYKDIHNIKVVGKIDVYARIMNILQVGQKKMR
jgi:hypothetical protein